MFFFQFDISINVLVSSFIIFLTHATLNYYFYGNVASVPKTLFISYSFISASGHACIKLNVIFVALLTVIAHQKINLKNLIRDLSLWTNDCTAKLFVFTCLSFELGHCVRNSMDISRSQNKN